MTTKTYVTEAARWTALSTRDKGAASSFFYGVRTTKIYCRPNCPSRLARRSNVVYFDSVAEAEAEEYRPCKRCRPETGVQPDEDPIQKTIKRAVEIVKEEADNGRKISLTDLSKRTGVSKWHLQRVFRRTNGLTPHQMATAVIARSSSTHDSGIATPSSVGMNMADQAQTEDVLFSRSGCNSTLSGFEIDPDDFTMLQATDLAVPVGADFDIESLQMASDHAFTAQQLAYLTPESCLNENNFEWLNEARWDEFFSNTTVDTIGFNSAINAISESTDTYEIDAIPEWQIHALTSVNEESIGSSYQHQEGPFI